MKVAVVGTGNIARHHLSALRDVPGTQVVAVCDLSRAAAEATAERFAVPRWYTDHRALLTEARPDVVHVTTPPRAHLEVCVDALDAGAHVVVEKPAAPAYRDVETLVERARQAGRVLVEDYNYLFNAPVRRLLDLVSAGRSGQVVHAEVTLCLDTGGHGGASEFTPHLASLAHAVIGPHRRTWVAHSSPDGLQALVAGEDATASICFSGRARPDTFLLRVHTTELRATATLFEPGFFVETSRPGLSRPLVPFVNGIAQTAATGQAAVGSLWGKLKGGPGSYEGLWSLLRGTYEALGDRREPPVSLRRVLEVNRLRAELEERAP